MLGVKIVKTDVWGVILYYLIGQRELGRCTFFDTKDKMEYPRPEERQAACRVEKRRKVDLGPVFLTKSRYWLAKKTSESAHKTLKKIKG